MKPTADHVATAIVGACKEIGADPHPLAAQIAMGVTNPPGRGGDKLVTQARAYAAVALCAAFPDVARPEIARLVGAAMPAQYVASINYRLKGGQLR